MTRLAGEGAHRWLKGAMDKHPPRAASAPLLAAGVRCAVSASLLSC